MAAASLMWADCLVDGCDQIVPVPIRLSDLHVTREGSTPTATVICEPDLEPLRRHLKQSHGITSDG